MTKKELIQCFADEFGVSRAKGATILKSVSTILTNALRKEGDTLVLEGLGRFKVKMRKAYRGCNPKTQERVWVPAKLIIQLKQYPASFRPKVIQP